MNLRKLKKLKKENAIQNLAIERRKLMREKWYENKRKIRYIEAINFLLNHIQTNMGHYYIERCPILIEIIKSGRILDRILDRISRLSDINDCLV